MVRFNYSFGYHPYLLATNLVFCKSSIEYWGIFQSLIWYLPCLPSYKSGIMQVFYWVLRYLPITYWVHPYLPAANMVLCKSSIKYQGIFQSLIRYLPCLPATNLVLCKFSIKYQGTFQPFIGYLPCLLATNHYFLFFHIT